MQKEKFFRNIFYVGVKKNKDVSEYQTPQVYLRNREKPYLYCLKKSAYRSLIRY